MRYVLAAFGAFIFVLIAFFLFRDSDWEIKNNPPENNTIVAFGDSLVDGVGATPGNDFVSVLSRQIGREIINHGVPGDTTRMGLQRIDEVIEEEPGVVIVVLGGNDALKRVKREETETNLRAITRTLQESGSLVILTGVRGGIFGDPYDEMYEEVAREEGAVYIPNILAGILGKADLTFDQIHPNDAGYRIVAERIYEVLREYL